MWFHCVILKSVCGALWIQIEYSSRQGPQIFPKSRCYNGDMKRSSATEDSQFWTDIWHFLPHECELGGMQQLCQNYLAALYSISCLCNQLPGFIHPNFKDTLLKGRFFSIFQENICQKYVFLCLCSELNTEEDLVITAVSFVLWGKQCHWKLELVALKSIKIHKTLLQFVLSVCHKRCREFC